MPPPDNPRGSLNMRNLALTSPEMHGTDIRKLQKILNERLAHFKSRQRIKQNGIYDRETDHTVAKIAYRMGLEHFTGKPSVLHLIEHPHLRDPHQLMRERSRTKSAGEHKTISTGAHGLARVPKIAAHYIGVSEHPKGSNWGSPHPEDWERHFGFQSGVPWCGCFACSTVIMAGGHVTGGVGFCPNIEAFARAGVNGFAQWSATDRAGQNHVGPGWLPLFNWDGGSEAQHVGIVEKMFSTHVQTIEGNTSGDNPSDGGMVARMERPYHFIVGFAKPRM